MTQILDGTGSRFGLGGRLGLGRSLIDVDTELHIFGIDVESLCGLLRLGDERLPETVLPIDDDRPNRRLDFERRALRGFVSRQADISPGRSLLLLWRLLGLGESSEASFVRVDVVEGLERGPAVGLRDPFFVPCVSGVLDIVCFWKLKKNIE